jgi:hypothetical protein
VAQDLSIQEATLKAAGCQVIRAEKRSGASPAPFAAWLPRARAREPAGPERPPMAACRLTYAIGIANGNRGYWDSGRGDNAQSIGLIGTIAFCPGVDAAQLVDHVEAGSPARAFSG